MKHATILLLLLLSIQVVFSQEPFSTESDDFISQFVTDVSTDGWVTFSEEQPANLESFWTFYSSDYGFRDQDSMSLRSRTIDELGITLGRFDQFYHGIPVEFGEYSLFEKGERVYLGFGTIIQELSLSPVPSISKKQALATAYNEILREFETETNDSNGILSQTISEKRLDSLQNIQLIVARVLGKEYDSKNYVLCWYVPISLHSPHLHKGIYVDAQCGEILQIKSLTHSCNSSTGSFTSIYYGNQSFTTRQRGWPFNDFRLEDCSRKIETRISDLQAISGIVENNTNNWGTTHQTETSAYWAMQQSWDFYSNEFGREGSNDNYKKIDLYSFSSGGSFLGLINSGKDQIYVGVNENGASETTLDICGHEYTHAVIRSTSNLTFQDEPGTLNESFSDIMGTMVERYVNGGPYDFLIANDTGTPYRDMSDPKSINQGAFFDRLDMGQPDTYLEPVFWYTGEADEGGVHINNGVQNKWFHLLSQGGTHNGIAVPGIGTQNAMKITYRNMTTYMQQNSEHSDARSGAVSSAIDLFGSCSPQKFATERAWAAVGVGTVPNTFCVSISGPSQLDNCSNYGTIFQANTISGQVCTWYPPSGWTVQYSGPGNNTMSVLSIAPWASTNTIVGVTVLFDGISVYDSHSVTIQSCPFYRLEAERKRSYSVAPQPASDFIVITSAGDEIDAILDIYDLSGRLISSTKGSFPVHKMRISDLPSGLYILKIRPIGLQPYTTRIYVQ